MLGPGLSGDCACSGRILHGNLTQDLCCLLEFLTIGFELYMLVGFSLILAVLRLEDGKKKAQL